jgi:hypothetical protein
MPERFIDYDAARAEREREPLILKAFGRSFKLPSQMPASLFLDLVRMEEERGSAEELTIRDAFRLMSHVLPKPVLDELMEHKELSVDDFGELVGMIVQAYKGDDLGEAPAPDRDARPPKAATRPRGSHAGSTSSQTRPASPGCRSLSTGP